MMALSFFAQQDHSGDDPDFNKLYQVVSDVHRAMSDLEAKQPHLDFFGLKRK